MKTLNIIRSSVLCILVMALSGCHETYKAFFEEMANEIGWNREQKLAARYESYPLLFLKKKEGPVDGFEIFYSRLTNAELLKKIKEMQDAIETELDYKDEKTVKYINLAETRKFLEHQERVFNALERRLQANELLHAFRREIGIHENSADHGMSEGRDVVDVDSRYFPEKIFVLDARSIFSAESPQIQEAQKLGTLKLIATVVVNSEEMFGYKEPDPNDPLDAHKFIWQPRTIGLELKAYRIFDKEKPKDSQPHYLEARRIRFSKNVDDAHIVAYREALPAVRVFYDPIKYSGIEVIDFDAENEPGHGIPDKIAPSGAISAYNNYANTLFGDAFPIKAIKRRIEPKLKEQIVEIAPIGEVINVWQESPDADGWKVPVAYKNRKGDNYHIKLMWKMPDIAIPGQSKYIAALKKEWHGNESDTGGPGAVFEYYKLKSPFDGGLVDAKVLYKENTKRVLFIFSDGSEIGGMIVPLSNKFAEDTAYAVEYSSGDIRWRLESTKRNGVYDRRKRVAFPLTTKVGQYDVYDTEHLKSRDGEQDHQH